MMPLHCKRCYQVFSKQPLLDSHIYAEQRCSKRPTPLIFEGIDDDQHGLLKCRTGLSNMNEREKWENVYRILFPEDTIIPDPCEYKIYHKF